MITTLLTEIFQTRKIIIHLPIELLTILFSKFENFNSLVYYFLNPVVLSKAREPIQVKGYKILTERWWYNKYITSINQKSKKEDTC